MNAATSPSSSSQLKTIVTLFVMLRVSILLIYTPQSLFNAYPVTCRRSVPEFMAGLPICPAVVPLTTPLPSGTLTFVY